MKKEKKINLLFFYIGAFFALLGIILLYNQNILTGNVIFLSIYKASLFKIVGLFMFLTGFITLLISFRKK
jgi:hypothetical protein